MKKGDLVLIPFPFTDLSGIKTRPALILAVNQQDIVVAFVSTQLHWAAPEDILLSPDTTNGLKKPSLLRLEKIATLERGLVLGKLGEISPPQIQQVNQSLIRIFQL